MSTNSRVVRVSFLDRFPNPCFQPLVIRVGNVARDFLAQVVLGRVRQAALIAAVERSPSLAHISYTAKNPSQFVYVNDTIHRNLYRISLR